MKLCNKCNLKKVSQDFGLRSASNDGLAAHCKLCQSIYDKQRNNDPQRVKSREAYLKTDLGRKAANKAKKKWASQNPIKRSANIIVGNAVRDKKIIKPSCCEKCFINTDRIEGHHCDYAFPLVVNWLCPACHNKWHQLNGEALNSGL